MATQDKVAFQLYVDGLAMDGGMMDALSRVEVEERCLGASSASLRFTLVPGDGDWDPLHREELTLLRRISIGITRGEDEQVLVFDGYITAVEPWFAELRVPESYVEVRCLDASCLMHLDARQATWDQKSDGDIARKLFSDYGFSVAGVQDGTRRDASRAHWVQRSSDADFLRKLAKRNGFECYLESTKAEPETGEHPGASLVAHFRPPGLEEPVQPALELFPEATTTVMDLRARWDLHRPARVRGGHLDERTRHWLEEEIDSPSPRQGDKLPTQGTQTRLDLVRDRLNTLAKGRRLEMVGLQLDQVPHDPSEIHTLAWSAYVHEHWLAEATVRVQGLRYPGVLRARRPIALLGAGKLMDGPWYAQQVRHQWIRDDSPARYELDVSLVRNALGEA